MSNQEQVSGEAVKDLDVGQAADKALGEVLYMLEEMLTAMNEPDWYDEVQAVTGLPSVKAWRRRKRAAANQHTGETP